MNEPDKNQELLRDVLRDYETPVFEQALLSRLLMAAARRRHFRQARRVVLGVVALAAVVLLLVRPKGPAGPVPVTITTPPKPYTLVQTRPVPAEWIVLTAPTAEIITTAARAPELRELTDDELLALAPSPAILVRHGPHLAELVFADPAAEEALFQN